MTISKNVLYSFASSLSVAALTRIMCGKRRQLGESPVGEMPFHLFMKRFVMRLHLKIFLETETLSG